MIQSVKVKYCSSTYLQLKSKTQKRIGVFSNRTEQQLLAIRPATISTNILAINTNNTVS